MATIRVFDAPLNRYFTVTVNLYATVLDRVDGAITDMSVDYYLRISTTMIKSTGDAFPTFLVRKLSDHAPGYSNAANFTDLINDYIDYFIITAEIGMSTSSSSYIENWSSSSSSKSSSSHSSFSSSSSSSSSEGFSSSSSSSLSSSSSSSS